MRQNLGCDSRGLVDIIVAMTGDLLSIPTPRVVVERSRLHANIAAMQARATRAGVRQMPYDAVVASVDGAAQVPQLRDRIVDFRRDAGELLA